MPRGPDDAIPNPHPPPRPDLHPDPRVEQNERRQEQEDEPDTVLGTDGSYNPSTGRAGGGVAIHTLPQSVPLSRQPLDPYGENWGVPPGLTDDSTKPELWAYIIAAVTARQTELLKIFIDSKSAISIIEEALREVRSPRTHTVRSKWNRTYYRERGIIESLLARRIRKGYPIPIITHVKSHVIGTVPGNQVRLEHHLNERADDIAKAAAETLEPHPAHRLIGLPRFFLTDLNTGHPINHHARHVITKRTQDGILEYWAQENRTHGQLLRGNVDKELVKAAAKYLGNTPAFRKQDKMHILAVTQQIPVPKIIARRGEPEAHAYVERIVTCTHPACQHTNPPLDAAHLITGRCHESLWAAVRSEILLQIQKVRQDESVHKYWVDEGTLDPSTGQPAAPPKDGYLPDEFPEKGVTGRELNWLNPRWPPQRDEATYAARTTGRKPTDQPGIHPRDLPCPPDPLSEPGVHLTPHQAHEELNRTNPLRTILGAPPTQLRSLFRALNANPDRATRLWARTIAPILLDALSFALTEDRRLFQSNGCPFAHRCVTCRKGQEGEEMGGGEEQQSDETGRGSEGGSAREERARRDDPGAKPKTTTRKRRRKTPNQYRIRKRQHANAGAEHNGRAEAHQRSRLVRPAK